MYFKEFYVCPSCGRATSRDISGEKQKYFVCLVCGKILCREQDLNDFDDNYCINCGTELTSAKKEALALVDKEN